MDNKIQAAVAGAREAMDGFMSAFNAEDGDAMRTRWFHFPHVRFHSGTVTVMERPEDFRSTVWERNGEAKDWARTAWDYVEVVAFARMVARSAATSHFTSLRFRMDDGAFKVGPVGRTRVKFSY